MMNFDEELVVKKMDEQGGGFVKSLANCFRHADPQNFEKLKETFSDYWNEYERRTR